MRNWTGIQLDTAATDPGTPYAFNVNYQIGGELRRRAGMSAYSSTSGVVMASFTAPMTGDFAIFATSTGTVEAIAAP